MSKLGKKATPKGHCLCKTTGSVFIQRCSCKNMNRFSVQGAYSSLVAYAKLLGRILFKVALANTWIGLGEYKENKKVLGQFALKKEFSQFIKENSNLSS